MTEEEIEKVLRDHEERLQTLEAAAGIERAPTSYGELREAAHQALKQRIHGEKS